MAFILKQKLVQLEEFWVIIFALLIAWFLAAHQHLSHDTFSVLCNYLYWTFRILIEAAFFMTALFTIEKYLGKFMPIWGCYLTSIVLSLIPFTLVITALDLIIGLPELGLDNPSNDARGLAFLLELIYLSDNHFLLSLLISIPRFFLSTNSLNQNASSTDNAPSSEVTKPLTFFDALKPPLETQVYSIEAQEHYILITTENDSRMILHRFSDAIQQTPATLGMQVHRSHWVAHSAIKDILIEGQSMKLKLLNDKEIPVSRTFRATVEKTLNQ